jgi:hypothetical protein
MTFWDGRWRGAGFNCCNIVKMVGSATVCRYLQSPNPYWSTFACMVSPNDSLFYWKIKCLILRRVYNEDAMKLEKRRTKRGKKDYALRGIWTNTLGCLLYQDSNFIVPFSIRLVCILNTLSSIWGSWPIPAAIHLRVAKSR